MQEEYIAIVAALRRVVKNRGLTYGDLAAKLGTSEMTVKRLFAVKGEHIGRVMEICRLIELPFAELAAMAAETREQTFELTLPQEEALAAQIECLALYTELLKGAEPAEVKVRWNIDSIAVARWLKVLEELKLLERLPGDRVRLKHRGVLHFRKGGPLIRRVLEKDVVPFFLDATTIFMDERDNGRSFAALSEARVSANTLQRMTQELRLLFQTFRRAAQYDSQLFPSPELIDIRWVAALAPSRTFAAAVFDGA
jgi:transcriptional regulator with XRE-family HTH domain